MPARNSMSLSRRRLQARSFEAMLPAGITVRVFAILFKPGFQIGFWVANKYIAIIWGTARGAKCKTSITEPPPQPSPFYRGDGQIPRRFAAAPFLKGANLHGRASAGGNE